MQVLDLSDEDRDVDIESDDGYELEDELGAASNLTQVEKRAHHNALERRRRDHIKGSFHSLRDSVPNLHGEKASRAQILKQATEYIEFIGKKNRSIAQDISDLKRQNSVLEEQVRALEKAKRAGTFVNSLNIHAGNSNNDLKDNDSDSDTEQFEPQKRKKMRT